MTTFSYTAFTESGKKTSGNIDAASKAAATKSISAQGLKPLSVKPHKKSGFDPNNIKIPLINADKIKTKDLVVFTRQLATMINAGVPLVKSLSTMQQQTDNDFFKEILAEVSKDVESGLSFAESLEKHPKAFNEVYVNMIAAGEAGGILDDILKRLAAQQEKEASIKKKVKSASTYPIILLFITFGAFFGLMIFVIPSIGEIIIDLGGEDAQLPPLTQAMLAISDFMVSNAAVVLGGFIGGIYLFKRYISTPKGRKKWHTFLLKVPVMKTIIAKVAIARFARTFASLMSAGVSVIESLEVTSKAIGNVVIAEEIMNAKEDVKAGKQLSEPIAQSKTFPPIVSQMLAIGEETGQSDTILLKVADFYEEEVDAIIDGLSSIIEPVMIVILGAMVGLIAYSVMGPIASLSQNIN